MTDSRIQTDLGSLPMEDPLAFFITWPTYGTWLPGDERGWVEYHCGWQLPKPALELECKSRMTEEACMLNLSQRQLCERQVAETCHYRKWQMLAVAARSNHMHIVVAAQKTNPKKIRKDIKAWCARRLGASFDPTRENWWAERGSIRYIWTEDSLAIVIAYVNEAQNRKELGIPTQSSQPDA
jgi:REP element-mobilizing transposase RayT